MYMKALSGRDISHVIHSKGQQEDSTAVLSLGFIKWNIDDFASQAYMIHDGIMIAMYIRMISYR